MDSLCQPRQEKNLRYRSTPTERPTRFRSRSRSRSRSTSTSGSSNNSNLRRQLSSFAWVQCDNIKCLKWRKISSAAAENLANKTWTCNMNEDPDFQSCSVPEEDTALFDRLAKKAKLDLVKSEIEKGSLVWAKMDGYCRWPALITDDPACDMHADGEEEEILWYHVEFLGSERSHGWVQTKRVEKFGTNFDTQDSKEASTAKTKIIKKGSKKGKAKRNVKAVKGGKLKKTYKGGSTVQNAISEALSLLPLQLDDRIKTSWFVSEGSGLKGSVSAPERKKDKKKDVKPLATFSKEKKPVARRAKSCANELQIFPERDNQIEKKSDRIKSKTFENISVKNSNKSGVGVENQKSSLTRACKLNNSKIDAEIAHYSVKPPSGLKCLSFPSSLIDTSKEERFMLDVQMYKRNEKTFEDDVKRFMISHGLSLSSPPVWQHVKVSIFSIFLAVYERGGYDLVCENRQWGQVYTEVTHQPTKQGSSVVKNFYKRNIYAYELFVTAQDFKLAVISLQQETKRQKTQATSKESKTFTSSLSTEAKSQEPEDSCSELSEYLDSLDEILKVLGQQENDLAQQVPHLNQFSGLSYLQEFDPLENLVETASITGKALEPEESAQVVPELDFPSSVESSNQGSDIQGFHEMQALQLDVGELDNQINHL